MPRRATEPGAPLADARRSLRLAWLLAAGRGDRRGRDDGDRQRGDPSDATTGFQMNGFNRVWCRSQDPEHACQNDCLADERKQEWRKIMHRYLGTD